MITKRAEEIRPFIVMDVLERAQELESQGEHVIHLEVGEPDFDTPACIRAAGERALREGKTHYTHSQGLLELRQAICENYQERYGIEITPEQVIVTSGTSPAMLLIFGALLEPWRALGGLLGRRRPQMAPQGCQNSSKMGLKKDLGKIPN